jgi:hypothetical protein
MSQNQHSNLPDGHDEPGIQSDIKNFKLYGGFFHTEQCAIDNLDTSYPELLGKLSYKSIVRQDETVSILLGERCYSLVQYAYETYTFMTDWPWEKPASDVSQKISKARKSGKLKYFSKDFYDDSYKPPLLVSTGYYVIFGEVLEWALFQKIILAPQLKRILRIFQPQPTSKFNSDRLKLQATFQTLWHLNKDVNTDQIVEHPIIKKACKKDRDQKTLKDIARPVDPRPPKAKTKSKKILEGAYYPPRVIPKVIVTENKINVLDVNRLKVVCETISELLKSQGQSSDLSHPLIEIYLRDAHPLIKGMAIGWISSKS